MMQWSKELGIPYYALRGRILAGWTPDRALTTPVRRLRRDNPGQLLSCRGEEHTLSEWCRLRGLSLSTVYCRLKRGVPFEKALGFDA